MRDAGLLDDVEHVGVRVALGRREALDAVEDVVGRHLAAVHGRLRVPARAAAELEDVDRVARLAPGLGQVGRRGMMSEGSEE